MKIKYAIFDFDGTLFDSMPIWDSVGETYLTSLGKKPKPSLREDVRALSLYQAACYLKREYELKLSENEIMDGINRIIEDFYIHKVRPKSGAAGFLEKMKDAGISMCIATASERYQIEAALRRCGLYGYFEEILTCSETGHGKDEPFIFQKAMKCLGADYGTTVVFEDAIHAVKTAKAGGFMVAAVYDESEEHQSEIRDISDCYIRDFEHTEDFWRFAYGK